MTLTAPPVKQEWQLPPLPDEVLLHVFDYLDLSATVAALRVSRHWHELANDPRVWKRLCGESGFPKVDRRRFGGDWKRWYRCMTERIAVDAFQNDCAGKPRRNEYSPIRVLVEPDASVLTLVRAIACSSMTPPHKIRLWRIDDFEDNEKGLVLLQDPTQKLADAGITSNTAVLYELPDARNGYLRPCRSSTSSLPATSNNNNNVEAQGGVVRSQQALENALREMELTASILTRVFFDDYAMDAHHYRAQHYRVDGDDTQREEEEAEEEEEDDDDELQHILAVSMAEMERRND